MTAPSKAVNDRPGRRGQPAAKKRTRKRPRPITIAMAVGITLVTFGLMVFAFISVWQPSNVTQAPEGVPTVLPTSAYASGLKVEDNGPPRKDEANGQWVIPLKVTNSVMMPHRQEGTPSPNETPVPAPVTVRSATVKVLLYGTTEDRPERHLLGVGYGGFAEPEGLAPGASTTFEVPIAGFEEATVTEYDGYADLLSTDQDPLPEEEGGAQPVQTPSIIPLATTTRGTSSP